MSKILESEFRKELYKNLTEAGYDKNEAQGIIAKKYFIALKEDVSEKLTGATKSLSENDFNIDLKSIAEGIMELKKMFLFLQGKEESDSKD